MNNSTEGDTKRLFWPFAATFHLTTLPEGNEAKSRDIQRPSRIDVKKYRVMEQCAISVPTIWGLVQSLTTTKKPEIFQFLSQLGRINFFLFVMIKY
jgi:hypothetical protein